MTQLVSDQLGFELGLPKSSSGFFPAFSGAECIQKAVLTLRCSKTRLLVLQGVMLVCQVYQHHYTDWVVPSVTLYALAILEGGSWRGRWQQGWSLGWEHFLPYRQQLSHSVFTRLFPWSGTLLGAYFPWKT